MLIVGLLASLVGITQALGGAEAVDRPASPRSFERELGRQTAPHQQHHDPEKQRH